MNAELKELKAAHQIIRNALSIMTTAQKVKWQKLNERDGVDGEGTTRANERLAVIEAHKRQLGDAESRLYEVSVHCANVEHRRDEILSALTDLLDVIEEPPERNCSCHISPPCSDCVDNSGLRDALKGARAAIAKALP